MKMLRYWKIMLGLLLVFGAGAVSGSVATHHFIKREFDRAMNFGNWKAGVMDTLQTKLMLTPEQHQKVEVLVDHRGREAREAFLRTFVECGHILVQLQHQIDEQLSPTQREIHDQMKRDFRAELKKRFNFDLPQD